MKSLEGLFIALAIGLLIGVERGWHERAASEGARIAGIRTFGLIGLLGGLWAMLAKDLGEILLGFAFFAFSVIMIVAHVLDTRVDRDYGITTVVASMVTFALGALAVQSYKYVAVTGAVITTTLLSLKPFLHRWLEHLEAVELYAALKFLLISVVLLPVLPNQGYGPWNALNPYEIWWMVVLIAGISFTGYFAMKVAGVKRGIMLTSLFGGMVSSTAVTLNFARLGRKNEMQRLLSAGILTAAGTMFIRIIIEVTVVNPHLIRYLAIPMSTMMLSVFGCAAWLWHYRTSETLSFKLPLSNPFQLLPAVQFGLILAAVMLLAKAFLALLGETWIYLLASISSITDVDAITLSLSRLALDDISNQVAARSIVLAAIVNTLVKAGIAVIVARGKIAVDIAVSLIFAAILGGLTLFLI